MLDTHSFAKNPLTGIILKFWKMVLKKEKLRKLLSFPKINLPLNPNDGVELKFFHEGTTDRTSFKF